MLMLLVPLAMGGLMLVHVGLGRTHSAAHAALGCVAAISVAAIVYIFFGHGVFGSVLESGHTLWIGGRPWGWIGLPSLSAPPNLEHAEPALRVVFPVFCVGVAALVPLSAGADRWRLGGTLLSTALLAGWVYPLFAHWAWAGGWLAQLGANYGLGAGFQDVGGSGVVQAVGGLEALAVTWLLGPRRTKFQANGAVAALPGHNIVFVLFGCLLMLPGWIGLNAAGAMLLHAAPMGGAGLIAVDTLLSAAGALLAALTLTRARFGKPDASLSANGWVAGLVASSAGCASLTPFASLLTGVIAGILVIYATEFLELKLSIDDPAGSVSVHAVAGMWGLLALGIFGRHTLPGQMLAQMVGVGTLLGCTLPMAYLLNWCGDRIYRYRASDDGERQGMDLHELGSGAYPEFVVHREDFSQR
jgi:Amt family ammonium transporter